MAQHPTGDLYRSEGRRRCAGAGAGGGHHRHHLRDDLGLHASARNDPGAPRQRGSANLYDNRDPGNWYPPVALQHSYHQYLLHRTESVGGGSCGLAEHGRHARYDLGQWRCSGRSIPREGEFVQRGFRVLCCGILGVHHHGTDLSLHDVSHRAIQDRACRAAGARPALHHQLVLRHDEAIFRGVGRTACQLRADHRVGSCGHILDVIRLDEVCRRHSVPRGGDPDSRCCRYVVARGYGVPGDAPGHAHGGGAR